MSSGRFKMSYEQGIYLKSIYNLSYVIRFKVARNSLKHLYFDGSLSPLLII